jgi:tetratricopeptide (TPR) repeat protein
VIVRKSSSAVALAISSLALSGCQALFGTPSFAERTPSAESASLDMSDYFTARLEAGRMHMAQGRPGAALTAFRQASYDPAHAGRAYNGMAVAYTQLGRPDLARRYFTMAVAAEPQDERFARNLARLEQRPVSGVDGTGLASVTQATSQTAESDGFADESGANKSSALRRVSPREIQISSPTVPRADKAIVSTGPGSGRAEREVALRALTPAQRYPVRIELPRAAESNTAGYPVRIALADVSVTQRASYPIRIELPEAD